MYIILQYINDYIIRQSHNYFPNHYLQALKYKQKESVVARYLISKLIEKYFGIKNFLPKVDKNQVPIFENDIFWSISHKKGIVFVGVSKQKIGLDLEIIKKRDKSLLNIFQENEYKLLGGKNWDNFYSLWTAKEAIIKCNLGKLDDMKNIVLTDVIVENKIISNIIFDKKLVFGQKNVYSGREKEIVYMINEDKIKR